MLPTMMLPTNASFVKVLMQVSANKQGCQLDALMLDSDTCSRFVCHVYLVYLVYHFISTFC